MAKKEPSQGQVKHNISLWKWFPLGQVDAIWNLVEHLHQQLEPNLGKVIPGQPERKYLLEIEAVLDALQTLDDKIRAEYYPMPKKRISARPHLENGGRRSNKG